MIEHAEQFYSFAFWKDGEYLGRILAPSEQSAFFQMFEREYNLEYIKRNEITYTIEETEEQPNT